MPVRLTPAPTFREVLAKASRPLAGMWVCSGSAVVAEICAGAGLDWLLVDMEHAPNGLESVLAQLQAVAAYPTTPVVRIPIGDPVLVKQVLDLGAQNLMVPMVSSATQAEDLVRAVRYPPAGIRGVGSALARGARWNRVQDYLGRADEYVSLVVQIETVDAVAAAAEIAAVDGVFVGPSDLAALMGLLGQQAHGDVVEAVKRAVDAVQATGKPVGVNAFDPGVAQDYLSSGVQFVLVGADVSVLARSSEALADRWCPGFGTEAQ